MITHQHLSRKRRMIDSVKLTCFLSLCSSLRSAFGAFTSGLRRGVAAIMRGRAGAYVHSCAGRALTRILVALTPTGALALLPRPKICFTPTEILALKICSGWKNAPPFENKVRPREKLHCAILLRECGYNSHRCSFLVRRREGDAALYSAFAATSCRSFKLACCF